MSENVALHGLLLDKRIVERNMLRGLVSREEYQKHIDELEDCTELGVECSVSFGSDTPEVEEEEQPEAAPVES